MGNLKFSAKKQDNLERRLRFVCSESRGVHYALRWFLLCSRVMGVLPLSGLLSPSSSNVRFTLKSLYTLYYFITCCGQVILCFMSFYYIIEFGVTLSNITNTIFYASSMIITITLANTARCWTRFLSGVEEIERKLPPFTRNVAKYCNITTFIILFMAFVEHTLSVIYGQSVAKACDLENIGERYFAYNMPWIFYYLSYALWKGILFEFFNIQSTFMWSYSDLLIMVVSIYLSEHFVLHYKLLKKAMKQENFSADIFRIQYLKIAQLVNSFNARFGFLILLSFGTNLYWICTQLFYSLQQSNSGHIVAYDCDRKLLQKAQHGVIHALYFSYSFSFLVARTLLILLLAARVNSTSMAPQNLLYEVPTSKFDIEIQRYVDQLTNMKVAMTGYGFFYVTRTMILTLIGSIITYELVLLQFNK